MRATIYARYSSDNQKDASIEDQVRLCRARIEREGWSVGEVYADRAISGATILRPGYQRLLEDVRANRFDVLVAEALDRLSRDQEDIAGLYKQLTFASVTLITLSEGEINELHVGLKGTMNALFLKDLADKTRRGLEGRIRQGKSGGGNSYGYDVIHQPRSRLDIERGLRRINSGRASIVVRIFEEYASGKSPRKIAFLLNAEDIPGPTSKGWSASTINGNRARGTGILNNELYIGRLVWNRLHYVKDPNTGKRISRLNPEEEWIVHQVPDLRIVPDNLWEQVKARQNSVKKNTRPDLKSDRPFWERTRPKYLLSGLMKCAACGGSYTKISANLFGCATARNKGTCTNRLNIRSEKLETIILDGLKDQLMDPDLFKSFVEEFTNELNRLRMTKSAETDTKKTQLTRIQTQIDYLVTAIADGADALALNAKIRELEERNKTIKEELAQVPDDPPLLLHPNMAELYRRKISELTLLLLDPECRDKTFETIRSMIDEVRVIPDANGLSIELRGELAGILNLCREGRKPDQNGRAHAEQIKMVAGAGFEPATFRL